MEQLPDTPAGRQASWFLGYSRTEGRDMTVEEIAAHMRLQEPWTPENALERFRDDGPIRFTSSEEISPGELAVRLVFENEPNKRWLATFRVAEEPPHLITWLLFVRDVGERIVVREAAHSEGPVLAELERSSPVTVGAVSITYDRGEDFFAFARMMEETVNLVAEEDGEIVALHCGALHHVVVGENEYQAMLLHHTRIPPEHQKKGLFSALNVRVFQAFEGRMNAPYAYVAVDNAAANRLGGPGSWSFPALRALLPCESVAGESVGRQAKPEDASRLVDILNNCHRGEEMYLPYTAESFAGRLERDPELYSWRHLWATDQAVVGVWPAGLRVVRQEDGRRTETIRATVMDYGFLPGAEEEFERLLRAWCGWLFEQGTSELAVMTSQGSPNYQAVKMLATQIDAFDFRMQAPEPEGAAQRGLYVDPVYF